MRAQFVLSEIGIGLRRNLTMAVAAVITTSIALGIFGFGLLLREQVTTMKGYWYDKVEVTIFLCAAKGDRCPAPTTAAQREQLRADLAANPLVKSVFYESQSEAFKRFQEQFKRSPDLVRNTTADLLPDSFRVKLKDTTKTDVLASEYQDRSGVDQIQDLRKTLGKFFKILDVFQKVSIWVSGLALCAAVLLIFNTIRVSAFGRRRETGIMRLVGASNFYIQLPFLLEGALAGVVGAVFATFGLVALQVLVVDHTLRPQIQAIQFISDGAVWGVMPWLVLIGVGLSAAVSFLTLQKYLRI